MTFDKLIEAALAAPPGSIMYAKQTSPTDEKSPESTEFVFETINGQKPAEA
jgi:hypothetical protein